MKRFFQIFLLLFFLEPFSAFALDIVPGLKGYGTDTRAAYGNSKSPTIFIVTDLTNHNGTPGNSTRNGIPVKTGSFKEAINYNVDNKLIIFEVSGTVIVQETLYADNNYVTIAGHTAPSPGILFRGLTLIIKGHDILVQHIRVRVGDDTTKNDTEPSYRDGINITAYGNNPYNVVVDHCSISWAIDENMGVASYDRDGSAAHDITVSNCIIAQGLSKNMHDKVEHSKGILAGNVTALSFINNLFIHNGQRNPVFQGATMEAVMVDNFIYNAHDFQTHVGAGTATAKISFVGNVTEGGSNSQYTIRKAVLRVWSGASDSELYVLDNKCEAGTQSSASDWTVGCTNSYKSCVRNQTGHPDAAIRVTKPPVAWPSGLTSMGSSKVKDYVLANAGAYPSDRDSVDTYLISNGKNDIGNIIDCVDSSTIYYPSGTASAGGASKITLQNENDTSKTNDTYNGRTIEITSGTGSSQSRTISDYDGKTRIATVSSAWATTPDSTSVYRIAIDCTRNAGGWPVIEEKKTTHTIPADSHSDSDGDGYTNLEEWLHEFPLKRKKPGQEIAAPKRFTKKVSSKTSSGPIDVNATPETKALFKNLKAVASDSTKILFGHHSSTYHTVSADQSINTSDPKNLTGSHPALVGWDYRWVEWMKLTVKSHMEAAYNRGAVNAMLWHAKNPVTGGLFNDTTPAVTDIIPGGAKHNDFKLILDGLAAFVKSLKGSDGKLVPVIFRPYHEHNGSWYWWGRKYCTVNEFKTLWQFTVKYLRDTKNVHNLLYAYSPDKWQLNTDSDYLERYPGDNYVDILGIDVYYYTSPSTVIEHTKRVVKLAEARNKIPSLTESGYSGGVGIKGLGAYAGTTWFTKSFMNPIKNDTSANRIAYIQFWWNRNNTTYYVPYPGEKNEDDFFTFYNDPFTLFEDDLSNIYQ